MYRVCVCMCGVCVCVYVRISPQPLIQLLCLLLVGPLCLGIMVQGSQSEVVHVDPNGASPIWGIMLRVVLGRGESGGTGENNIGGIQAVG